MAKTKRIVLDLSPEEIHCLKTALAVLYKTMGETHYTANLNEKADLAKIAEDTIGYIEVIIKQIENSQKKWFSFFGRKS